MLDSDWPVTIDPFACLMSKHAGVYNQPKSGCTLKKMLLLCHGDGVGHIYRVKFQVLLTIQLNCLFTAKINVLVVVVSALNLRTSSRLTYDVSK